MVCMHVHSCTFLLVRVNSFVVSVIECLREIFRSFTTLSSSRRETKSKGMPMVIVHTEHMFVITDSLGQRVGEVI